MGRVSNCFIVENRFSLSAPKMCGVGERKSFSLLGEFIDWLCLYCFEFNYTEKSFVMV